MNDGTKKNGGIALKIPLLLRLMLMPTLMIVMLHLVMIIIAKAPPPSYQRWKM